MCIKTKTIWKSTDANMLVAYYSKVCDSHEIFDQLKISKIDSYKKHLNQHNVIHLNMQNFLSNSDDIEEIFIDLTESLYEELEEKFGKITVRKRILSKFLERLYSMYSISFIFNIDEWDCIFRNIRKIRKHKGSI